MKRNETAYGKDNRDRLGWGARGVVVTDGQVGNLAALAAMMRWLAGPNRQRARGPGEEKGHGKESCPGPGPGTCTLGSSCRKESWPAAQARGGCGAWASFQEKTLLLSDREAE